ncbi:MAG TPA: D-aminoacylase [Thermoanaerobaculia bacterium]|nr:D-aminoacylase [Thermoanaerobaculia bacterium]
MIGRALLAIVLSVAGVQAADYDILIRNARIVDGAGTPWFRGAIAVRGDSIVAIAPRIDGTASRVIDAGGRVVAPGFIDLHTHSRRGITDVPTAENYIRQGVTTIFEGPDGSSPLPIRDFLDRVEKLKTSPNFATFVGQGSVREAVIGNVDRKATAEEIEKMQSLVREAMRDGAFGLSTGLFYVPGTFTPTEEVIELARVAGEMGGIHQSHMRDEAAHVVDSVRETIRIGEEGHLPTQVTHHKIIGVDNWGKSVETLRLIDQARARGVDATIDQYPYTASSTSLAAAIFPKWAQEGSRDQMVGRLRDPAQRAKIREVAIDKIRHERGGGDPKNIQIASTSFDPSLAGKNLAEITRARGLEPTVENAADVALDMIEKGSVSGIFHAISEDDLQRILVHPATMIASDGEVPIFGKAAPHPRSYGTFARILGVYVREKKLLSLEEAVRKMSSMPAARVGLTDRGLLRPGMKADIVIFDPNTVADKATFAQPHQYAVGVSYVIVNGVFIIDDGKVTDARPGRVLRGPSFNRSRTP